VAPLRTRVGGVVPVAVAAVARIRHPVCTGDTHTNTSRRTMDSVHKDSINQRTVSFNRRLPVRRRRISRKWCTVLLLSPFLPLSALSATLFPVVVIGDVIRSLPPSATVLTSLTGWPSGCFVACRRRLENYLHAPFSGDTRKERKCHVTSWSRVCLADDGCSTTWFFADDGVIRCEIDNRLCSFTTIDSLTFGWNLLLLSLLLLLLLLLLLQLMWSWCPDP